MSYVLFYRIGSELFRSYRHISFFKVLGHFFFKFVVFDKKKQKIYRYRSLILRLFTRCQVKTVLFSLKTDVIEINKILFYCQH